MMATQGLASSGQHVSLNENSHPNICCCLFYNVPLIRVDDAQLCPVLEICDLHTCKIRTEIIFSHKFMILLQISKNITLPSLDQLQEACIKINQGFLA